MAIQVTIDGVSYSVPQTGERSWGDSTTDLLVTLSNNSLQIRGGSIPLTSEANFGASFGLKALYFRSINYSATHGTDNILELNTNDNIVWRNNADSADLALAISGSDRLQFEGSDVPTIDSTDTLSNKTLDNSNTITVQDANLTVQDDGDNTKQAKLDASGITAATTRTYTLPDADGEIALTSGIPSVPVTSVFTRTGDVTAQNNDYTWDQVDKTTSDIADITTKSHTSLTDIGTRTHTELESDIAAKQDDLITTRGDVIRGDSSGDAERLALGTNGQVLTSDGTDAVWADPTGGLTDPMTTRGDMIYRNASNTTDRLPVGTANQVLTSDGTDVSWEDAAGGSGGKNYILNPDAAVDTSDVANTATTGSWTIARTTTAAELPEETKGTAFKISGSGLTVNDTVEWAIETTGIDDADGGRIGSWEVAVKNISGSIGGEYKLQAYNVTNSEYVGDSFDLTDNDFTYQGTLPLNATEDYEMHLIALTASPSNIGISGVKIQPQTALVGAVVTDWKDAGIVAGDFTGFGTPTDINIQRRQVGNTYEYKGYFTTGGTTNTEARLDLGVTLDLAGSSTVPLGNVYRDDTTANSDIVVQGTDGDTYVTFGLASVTGFNPLLESDANALFASSERQGIEFSVPVAGLGGDTLLGTEAQTQNARAKFSRSTNYSYTAGDPIDFDTTEYNEGGGFTLESDGSITPNFTGKVSVNACLKQTGAAANNRADVNDGSADILSGAEFSGVSHSIAGDIDVVEGESFELQKIVSVTIAGGNENVTWVTVARIPDKSSSAVGFPISDVATTEKQYLVPAIIESAEGDLGTVTNWASPGSKKYRWVRTGNKIDFWWFITSNGGSSSSSSTSFGFDLPSDVPPPDDNLSNDFSGSFASIAASGATDGSFAKILSNYDGSDYSFTAFLNSSAAITYFGGHSTWMINP